MQSENEKYRFLIENLPDGFAYHRIVTDAGGNPVDYIFLDVNRAFEELTGLPRDKIIGKKVTAVLPELIFSEFDWIGTYGRVALSGERERFEQYSLPLGRWYEVTAYSDEPSFFVTVFRDISDKKQHKSLQTLVQFSEQHLQLPLGELDYQVITDHLLNLSGAKFTVFSTYTEDGKNTITRAVSGLLPAVRQAVELLGFELSGKKWNVIPGRLRRLKLETLLSFDNLHELAGDFLPGQLLSLLQKVFDLGCVYVIALSSREKIVGDFIFIMKRGETLRNPEIIELYVKQVGLALARSQLEGALQESKKRLSLAQSFAHTGTWEYDLENATLYWSKECAAVFGLAEGEFEGTFNAFLKRVHPQDQKFVLDMNKPITAGSEGLPLDYEHRIIRKDGAVRWVAERAGVVRDKAGEPVRIVGFVMDITRQKETELELQRSKNLLQNVFEGIQDGIRVINSDLTIQYVNSTINAWYRQHTPLEGKNCYEIFQGRAEPCPSCPAQRCLQTENTAREELFIYTDQGDKTVEISSYPLLEPGGKGIAGAIDIIRDITELKMTEEEQKRQLQLERIVSEISAMLAAVSATELDEELETVFQLAGLLINADSSFLFLLGDTDRRFVNTHTWRAAGTGPGVGKTDPGGRDDKIRAEGSRGREGQPQSLHVDDVPWLMQKFSRFEVIKLESLNELPPEAAAEKKLLQSFAVKSVLIVPLSSAGKNLGFISFASALKKRRWKQQQITLLRIIAEIISSALTKCRAEEKLRQSEERYKDLVEQTGDLVWDLDPACCIVYINPRAESLLGFTPEQMLGRNLLAYLEPDEAASKKHFFTAETLLQQAFCLFEHRIRHQNGTFVLLETRVIPLSDERGRFHGCRGISRDITVKKQAEEEKARVRVLHAIEEERLRLARDLHDEIGMALTTLKLDLQLLQKMLSKTGGQEQLQARLSSSIDKLNDSAQRVRSKSAFLRPPSLDDAGLITVVEGLLAELNKHSTIRAELITENKAIRLPRSLETALYRCIQESLTNVARHADAGRVTVHLSWTERTVTCCIRDDGKGFTGSVAANKSEGLGLRGMEERVFLLQGKMEIKSSPGAGTEIIIRLPLEPLKP